MEINGRITGKKIMIVDDSEINRAILKDMLEVEYETMEAADGEEALACIRRHEAEILLVLLDVVMPNMDGFTALSVMNRQNWLQEIPVIMISSEDSPAYVERAFSLGATDYISRPFNISIVLKRVQNTVALYSGRRALAGFGLYRAGDYEQAAALETEHSTAELQTKETRKAAAVQAEGEREAAAASVEAEREAAVSLCAERIQREKAIASDRTLKLLEEEREKYQFFAAMSQEIQFEYDAVADLMYFTTKGARERGFQELIAHPFQAESELLNIISPKDAVKLQEDARSASYQNPIVQETYLLNMKGERRWCKLIIRSMWSDPEEMSYKGFIGKILDVHDEHEKFHVLEQRASLDLLTGLYNQVTARNRIEQVLAEAPERKYGVLLFDLDRFKEANDQNGHLFGNCVLKFVADKIRSSTRKDDIAARIGGDEFLIFMEYDVRFDMQVQRLFEVLTDQYENFKISVSMGISLYPSDGLTYDEIFECADKALYASKRSGKNQYRYYSTDMKNLFSVLSPIDR